MGTSTGLGVTRAVAVLVCVGSLAARPAVQAPPALAPGDILAANLNDGSVARFDGRTGAFAGHFVEPGSGGLAGATGLAFGPDGHLYVASSATHQILRYDGVSGALRDVFVDGGELGGPFSLIFGPDGDLYVSSSSRHEVLRFDGASGEYRGTAASDSTLGTPIGLRFGPDGMIYVANARGASVDRYDPATGALLDRFVTGVRFASDLAFGDDGHLYVSSAAAFAVLRFDARSGAAVDTAVVLPDRGVPVGLAFGPDGRLFVADFGRSRLFAFDPGSGEVTLLSTEGLSGPENIAIVPDRDP